MPLHVSQPTSGQPQLFGRARDRNWFLVCNLQLTDACIQVPCLSRYVTSAAEKRCFNKCYSFVMRF